MRWIVAYIVAAAAMAISGLASADEARRLLVYDFELINTSLEADRPDETERLAMLTKMLRESSPLWTGFGSSTRHRCASASRGRRRFAIAMVAISTSVASWAPTWLLWGRFKRSAT